MWRRVSAMLAPPGRRALPYCHLRLRHPPRALPPWRRAANPRPRTGASAVASRGYASYAEATAACTTCALVRAAARTPDSVFGGVRWPPTPSDAYHDYWVAYLGAAPTRATRGRRTAAMHDFTRMGDPARDPAPSAPLGFGPGVARGDEGMQADDGEARALLRGRARRLRAAAAPDGASSDDGGGGRARLPPTAGCSRSSGSRRRTALSRTARARRAAAAAAAARGDFELAPAAPAALGRRSGC